jgi:hypothetical protein
MHILGLAARHFSKNASLQCPLQVLQLLPWCMRVRTFLEEWWALVPRRCCQTRKLQCTSQEKGAAESFCHILSNRPLSLSLSLSPSCPLSQTSLSHHLSLRRKGSGHRRRRRVLVSLPRSGEDSLSPHAFRSAKVPSPAPSHRSFFLI